jgi:hypothetical protein
VKFQSVRSIFPTGLAPLALPQACLAGTSTPPKKERRTAAEQPCGAVLSRFRPLAPLKSVDKTAMVPSAVSTRKS